MENWRAHRVCPQKDLVRWVAAQQLRICRNQRRAMSFRANKSGLDTRLRANSLFCVTMHLQSVTIAYPKREIVVCQRRLRGSWSLFIGLIAILSRALVLREFVCLESVGTQHVK